MSLRSGPSDCGPQPNLPQTIHPKGAPLREEASPTIDSLRKSPVLIPGDLIFAGVGPKTPGNLEFWSMKQNTTNNINVSDILNDSRNSSQGLDSISRQRGRKIKIPGIKPLL